ncbi:MAG: YdcF family protein, partial [Cyanobacteriota bacterium SKYGB_h_bin112]|nr:YdcF family protein [Cyanobacteriota bacterium SKYGB_h_bin112]
MRRQHRRWRKPRPSQAWLRWFPLLLVVTIGLGIGLDRLQAYLTKPQALLVLGGDHTRELFAAQFALQHPQL